MLSVKQGCIKYRVFKSLVWLDLGLNPGLPLVNTLTTILYYIYIYIQISLNIIDILCLHIFFCIHSNSRITFIVFGGKLIYLLSIVVYIPSTFCPTLGHHQGRIYNKSDVTFVLAYYYCVRASLPLKIMAFAFKRKYVDIKCLLCLMKFVLRKKCSQKIRIYIYIYIYMQCFTIVKIK